MARSRQSAPWLSPPRGQSWPRASCIWCRCSSGRPTASTTPEELAERHKRREQELDRAQAVLEPALAELKKQGTDATGESRHGHAGELLCQIAEEQKAVQIIIGRTGGSTSITSRILGSLAITLVHGSPVPVTVVP